MGTARGDPRRRSEGVAVATARNASCPVHAKRSSVHAGDPRVLPITLWAQWGCTVHRSLLLLAVALLQLVVAPTLNTHKPTARGPLDFYHGLLAAQRYEERPSETPIAPGLVSR